MRQSGLLWATSTVAFLLTAVAIVITGVLQESAQGNQADYPASVRLSADGSAAAHTPENYTPSDYTPSDYTPSDYTPSDYGNFQDSGLGNPLAPEVAYANAEPKSITDYQPPERVYLAHPSNYGERFTQDINGNSLNNPYIVVLHETVGSVASALNTFQTNNPNDNDQVSYHALIGLDGTVYYIVPPEQRAFGAGNSVFQGTAGDESVFTNADFPSSVNNFAYHVSLETPPDGNNNNASHSGYTDAQYQSLAWLLSRTTVPDERITTHRAVDRSGSRSDPRSFDTPYLLQLLRQYPSRAGL